MCAPADIFLALLAVLFPPLPVWIKTGICSLPSLVNILLSILGYIPGLLHAWYIIAAIPDPSATAYYYEEIRTGDVESGGQQPQRLPGPNAPGVIHGGPGAGSGAAGANAVNGYVAPAPQIGPRSYGTVGGPADGVGEQQPEGAPPSYDQAIRADNKVQHK